MAETISAADRERDAQGVGNPMIEYVDVHKAFLETTELQALCQQGSVRQAEPEAPARPAADEGEKEPGGEPGRRPATRRR